MRQINLLPEEFISGERSKNIRRSVISTAVLTFSAVLLIHSALAWRINYLDGQARALVNVSATPEVNRLRKELAASRAKTRTFRQRNKAILGILTEYLCYPYVLDSVSAAASDNVWLTSLTLGSKEQTCGLEGRSFDIQSVSQFMLELKKAPHFAGIDLDSMEKYVKNDKEYVVFSILCRFK